MAEPLVFQDTPVDEVVIEAYQRVKGVAQQMTGYEMKASINCLNYILTRWINKGMNLASVQQGMIGLIQGNIYYKLPTNIADIRGSTVYAVKTKRQLVGNPFASSGNAANAFDGNPATACTQNAADGNIGFTFDASQSLLYIGILSSGERQYTIAFEYSFDGLVWYTLNSPQKITYPQDETIWYVITNSQNARWWRIRETGGATLAISELYFSTNQFQTNIGRVSQAIFLNYQNKDSLGTVSQYCLFRGRNPTIGFYQNPNSTYDAVLFEAIEYFQPVTSPTDPVQIPQRYLDALVAALAADLSLKFAPEKYQLMKALADESYNEMASQDSEQTDLILTPWNFS